MSPLAYDNPTPFHALRRRWLTQAVLAALAAPLGTAMASETSAEFDSSFLVGASAQTIDLSRFAQGNAVLPGSYRADIQVNDVWLGRRDIRFAEDDDGETRLCLSRELLADFGVDFDKLEYHRREQMESDPAGDPIPNLPEGEFCEGLAMYLPDGEVRFDPNELSLEVSIPQLYLTRTPRGWVSPEQWDQGINAARLGYQFNHQYRRDDEGWGQSNSYLRLNSGLNLGLWRLRHNGALTYNSSEGGEYQASTTYLQRDLTDWRSQLTLGEAVTGGELFDGIAFRGVRVASDDRMLPDSQRGYAPVVRGVAETNALVTVRQRDQVIYETSVAPGPFEIDDLYPTGYGGDLEVTVTETDGRTQIFSVPFAALPQLLREGQNRFSLTGGEVRDQSLSDAPEMLEATWQRGLNNAFTAYLGATVAEGYQAALLGGAYNTSLGAFSGDMIHSHTNLPDSAGEAHGSSLSGQSLRLTYSKNLIETGTNFTLAAYRYSTDGYLNLSDGLRLRDNLANGQEFDRLARQRSRLDLTVNQTLGEGWGTTFLSGNTTSYWNRDNSSTSYSMGYNNSFRQINYSLYAQHIKVRYGDSSSSGHDDTSLNLTLSMPLGSSPATPNLSASYARADNGRDSARVGLSGTAGEERALNYGLSASHSDGGNTAFNGSVGYQSPMATLQAGYSHTGSADALSLGTSGGIIAHAGGINFAQKVSDTIGILHVPGAANLRVGSGSNLRTDSNGYAVVPDLMPYRLNEITVDPRGLPLDVELKSTAVKSAPRDGAVVQLAIESDIARSALIHALREDGQPLPFGVDVYDEMGEVAGVVGQGSRLWVRGIEERGQLFVQWGERADERCRIDYDLAERSQGDRAALTPLQSQCHDDAASLLFSEIAVEPFDERDLANR